MASAAQLANAQGLHVLLLQFGESFRVGDAGAPFTALRVERMSPDAIGGQIVRAALTAAASSVSGITEGTVLSETETGKKSRVVAIEDGPPGYINIIVAHEVR